jgi:hypothetical protein
MAFKPGDQISYQNAGMIKPEYGTIKSMARIDEHAFVRYGDETNGKLTDLRYCRLGKFPSWWRMDNKGNWHCEDTPK